MPIRVWDFQENRAKSVEDSEAEQGVLSGRYAFRKGVQIPLTTPAGESVTVASGEVSQAFQKGYKLTQPKSSEQIKQESEAEVAKNMPATAFLKNATSALTFGASDVVARTAGIEPGFAQQVEEQNPIASTAGTIAGTVGSAFMLPGKAITAGAEALGANVAAQTGSKVLGTTANFAADGMAYGFGSAISEAALGDPNEIANEIILGGGLGAGMGAFAGGISPIAKAVSSKLLAMGEQGVISASEKTLGSAAVKSAKKQYGDEAAGRLEEMITSKTDAGESQLSELLSPKKKMELADATSAEKDFNETAKVENAALKQEIRDAVKETGILLKTQKDETSASIKQLLDEAAKTAEQTPAEAARIFEDVSATIRTKADIQYGDAMERMKNGLTDAPLSDADNVKLAQLYEDLTLTAEKLTDNPRYSTRAGELVSSAVERMGVTPNSVERMTSLHELRKDLGSLAFGKKISKSDPYHESIVNTYNKINEVVDSMDNQYVKGFREADDVYTQAYQIQQLSNKFLLKSPQKTAADNITATAQKMMRAPGEFEALINNLSEFTDMVDPAMAEQLSKSAELIKGAKAATPSESILAQEKLLASIRDKMGDVKSAKPEEIAELVMSMTGRDIAENIAKKETLTNALSFIKSKPSMSSIDKMVYIKKALNPEGDDIAYLEKMAKDNNDLSFINSLKEKVPDTGIADQASKIGLGYALGSMGPVGALASMAVTKALDIARSPYNMAAALVAIESTAKTGRKVLESWSQGLGKALTSKPTTRTVINVANEKESYNTRVKSLQASANPVEFSDKLATSLRTLSSTPQVQLALMNQIQTANMYLQAEMPRDPLEGKYLNPAFSKWQPSTQDIAKFNRKWEAVENPNKMMEKFSDGTITKEEVQALKAVHPGIYSRMQKLTIETLSSMDEPVHYEKRISLGIMFEGITDPTLEPAYINYMQTLASKVKEQQPKPKSNLKFDADVLLSDAQRLSMT